MVVATHGGLCGRGPITKGNENTTILSLRLLYTNESKIMTLNPTRWTFKLKLVSKNWLDKTGVSSFTFL